VRQSEPLSRQPLGRVIALTIFCGAVALFFFYPRVSSTAFEPQGRRRPQPKTTRPQPTTEAQTSGRGGGRNYSRFKHEDHRAPVAKLDCADCHAIPNAAAPDAIAAATKPGIKGYPYHDSCVRCHRQQFFQGASPPICNVCHTRSSPRLTARDMDPFPKEGDQTVAREFPGYFPHALHQGVIARRTQTGNDDSIFVRAVFKPFADTPTQAVDNCATCHVTDTRPPTEITVGGTEGKFKPGAAGTFKTSPDGHASCFNCHWQSQKPTKDDCAGCHLSQSDYAKAKRTASFNAPLPGVLSPNAVQWFKTWPKDWPKRLSIKFRHESGSHDIGCTTCHINITQMERLNIPKADVPITTCAICHIKSNLKNDKTGEGVDETIYSEMTAEGKDADNKTHTCVGCHTTLIGRERPPCSHYLIIGQQCKQ